MRALSRLVPPSLTDSYRPYGTSAKDASYPRSPLTRTREPAGKKPRQVLLKPVVTVSDERLQVLGAALLDLMHDQGFAPEAFVAIANGGVKVVEAMPKHDVLAVWSCRLQRSSTERMKQKAVGRDLLRHLPYFLTNFFRLFEDWLQGRKCVTVPSPTSALAEELGRISADIERRRIHRVAVIDDAADSGATLACVMNCLRDSLSESVDLRSAVITATRAPERAAISPDFRLFDLTLLRFPWSLDYKGSYE
jgi:orotate phosphoribosyltransferase-like protein